METYIYEYQTKENDIDFQWESRFVSDVDMVPYFVDKNIIPDDTGLLNKVLLFLSDEYQLITLSKINFLVKERKKKKIIDRNTKITKIEDLVDVLNDKIMPVTMDITVNDYQYQFYQYYQLWNYFPENKKVVLIKPISHFQTHDNKVYSYNTIEEYLENERKCKVTTYYDPYMETNIEKNILKNMDKSKAFMINSMKEEMEWVYIKYMRVRRSEKMEEDMNISFLYFFENIQKILKLLKKGGTLWIELSFLPIQTVNLQLFYFLSTIFEKVKFIKTEIYKNDIHMGIFIFENLIERKEIDMNIEKVENEFISSIFQKKMKVTDEFKRYMKNVCKQMGKLLEDYHKRVKFCKEHLDYKLPTYEKFYTNLIERGLEWCKKNHVLVNPIYKDYEKKIPPNIKFRLFPREKGVDMNKIQVTFESIYSVSMPEEAQKISEIAKLFYPKTKTIVDCTANIGGNTINFAKHFKNVTSIEIDPQTKGVLENNVKLYGRDNVKIILGDYVELKDKIKGDVYFFDPPWGGIYYKVESTLDLFLSGVNIIDLLPENFILKAPINYNIQGLLKKFKNIVVYFITNFVLIIHLTEKMKIEDVSDILEDTEILTNRQIQNYEDNKYKDLLNFLNTL